MNQSLQIVYVKVIACFCLKPYAVGDFVCVYVCVLDISLDSYRSRQRFWVIFILCIHLKSSEWWFLDEQHGKDQEYSMEK